jgi:hypothetical protein
VNPGAYAAGLCYDSFAMMLFSTILAAGALFQGAGAPAPHFDVRASFSAPRRGGPAEVAVQFVARDPDVKINEIPAPRLKITSGPATVVTAPGKPPAGAKDGGSGSEPGRYLDLTLPVTFPVTVDPSAGRGSHDVKGTVTYFYCSKREGWCRKGTADVGFPVAVP